MTIEEKIEQITSFGSFAYAETLPFLWYFSRWLKDQAKNNCDGISYDDWFASTFALIHKCDNHKRELKKDEIRNFEKFNSLYKYFWYIKDNVAIDPLSLDPTLSNLMQNRLLKKEYSFGSLLTLEQFKLLLKIPDFIPDNKLIIIRAYWYVTAIVKKRELYHYFGCSNASDAQTTSADQLAELIFSVNKYKSNNPYPVGLEIFSFDDEEDLVNYPSSKNILNVINPALAAKEKKFEYSSIEVAAWVGNLELVKYFLGKYVGSIPIQDITAAFVKAAKYGYLEIIEELLKVKNFNVNSKGECGYTALIQASEIGQIGVVKFLLADKNINANIQNEFGDTALMYAAENGHVNIINELLTNKNTNINLKRTDGKMALSIAFYKKHIDVIKVLLKRKDIDINIKDDFLETPILVQAAENFDNASIIEDLLTRQDVNINDTALFGYTALIKAATYGHTEVIKKLLANKNINPNIQAMNKKTALMEAANNGHLEAVKILLKHLDINPNIKDRDNNTAFLLALKNNHFKIAQEILTDYRTDSDVRAKHGNNIFINASLNDHLEVFAEQQKNKSFKLCKHIDDATLINDEIKRASVKNLHDESVDVLINIGQIKEKVNLYLKCRNKDIDANFDVNYSEGIVLLWLYAKWQQCETSYNDYKWFKSTIELIENLNLEQSLSAKDIAEIDKFIMLIQNTQCITSYFWQDNLDKSLEEQEFKIEYFLLFTPEQIQNVLQKENIIQPGKLILIRSDNCVVALFKNESNYYYYFNPSCEDKEIKFTSTEELSQLIFNVFSTGVDGIKQPNVQLYILSFDASIIEYLGLMSTLCADNLQGEKQVLSQEAKVLDKCSIALIKAAYHNHLDIVKTLLSYSSINLNMQNGYGYTALMWAVSNCHFDIVKELLNDKRINPNIQNKNGLTAFTLAVMLKQLYIQSSKINFSCSDFKNVNVYLEKNINFKRGSNKDWFEIIQSFLLHPRIDPSIRDINGWNALKWVSEYNDTEIVEKLLNTKPEDILSCKSSAGTPAKEDAVALEAVLIINKDLIEASGRGDLKVVTTLLKCPYMDPNIQDCLGYTPLMKASYEGHLEIIKKLIEHPKIDLNIAVKNNCSDEDGWTAVVYAAKHKHFEIVDLLLTNPKINVSLCDDDGHTIFDLVKKYLQDQTV